MHALFVLLDAGRSPDPLDCATANTPPWAGPAIDLSTLDVVQTRLSSAVDGPALGAFWNVREHPYSMVSQLSSMVSQLSSLRSAASAFVKYFNSGTDELGLVDLMEFVRGVSRQPG